MYRRLSIVSIALFLYATAAHAQTFEVGVHAAGSQWSEFDGTDFGIGGRFTWRPSSMIGVDADLTWYPTEFPDGDFQIGNRAFSGDRIEGLFGLTAGPTLGALRPFARVAAGFLRSTEAPEPFACILIFPPPLVCVMAAGQTMPAVDVGGGVQVLTSDRTFVRVDVGGRFLRYPGPAFRLEPREILDENFWGAAFRFTLGGGLRF